MPIIFVHGVNNRREDPDYEPGRLAMGKFLARHLGGATIHGKRLPANVEPRFPYWGDLATRFAWDMRSLPGGEIDALGGAVDADLRAAVALMKDALGPAGAGAAEPLVTIARRSFPLAIDVLCDSLLKQPAGHSPEDVADFVVQAQEYALQFDPPKQPPWLAAVATDMQFVGRLLQELKGGGPGVEALGIVDRIGNAVSASVVKLKQAVSSAKTKVLDTVGDFASTKALAWSRAPLNATLGRFFGDVFHYMHGRGDKGHPGPIAARVLQDWDAAVAAAPGEPLVILGHSLGGVISYDLVSHFRPDVQVDLFVSIGSQVSHFEEMKLFRASDPTIPGGDYTKRVRKPQNIAHWINVFDEVDIFSYACARVFDGVHDFRYDTRTYVIKAHGAYFTQARFYERLRARIDAL